MKRVIKILFLSLAIVTIATSSYATDIIDQISPPKIDDGLAGNIKGVIGVIQLVGVLVAVVASIYLGIRYVISSTDEKADIKKKLIPFVVGVVMFYGATGILQLIADIAGWI